MSGYVNVCRGALWTYRTVLLHVLLIKEIQVHCIELLTMDKSCHSL